MSFEVFPRIFGDLSSLSRVLQQLGKAGIPSDPPLPNPREVLEWKIRNLRDLLQVFQLTGELGAAGIWGMEPGIPEGSEPEPSGVGNAGKVGNSRLGI